MSDVRKGTSSPAPATPSGSKKASTATPKHKPDEEATIKVASKKETAGGGAGGAGGSATPNSATKNGIIKLKKPPPKHKQPGNWKEGTFVDQEKKKSKTAGAGANSTTGSSIPAPSPSPVVNQLDETARETFATGRPLEDAPDLQMCKHCKKSVLSTAAKQHIAACLKIKKEKAQRKKEKKEERVRREQQAREEEEAAAAAARRAENGEDSDSEDGGGAGGSGGGSGGGTGGGGGVGGSAAAGGGDKKKPGKKGAGKKGGGADNASVSAAAGAGAAASAGSSASVAASGTAAAAPTATTTKKRKAEGEPDKGAAAPTKKKKKEETRTKTTKPKGPVDVERQCGVILPNGQPCARSLTCKSHSMGAKRAVAGRSLPYDMLLAAYQKKNQAKQQKAAIDASVPIEEDEDANGAAVDSEEEASAVISAMAQWRPQPVVPQPSIAPIRRQYQLARLHEQLSMATNGGRVNIFRVVGFGAQKLPEGHPGLLDQEDAPGEPDDEVLPNGTAGGGAMLPPTVPGGAANSSHTSTPTIPVTPVLPPPIPSSMTRGSSSPSPSMRNQSSPATAVQQALPVSSRG